MINRAKGKIFPAPDLFFWHYKPLGRLDRFLAFTDRLSPPCGFGRACLCEISSIVLFRVIPLVRTLVLGTEHNPIGTGRRLQGVKVAFDSLSAR